MDDTKSPHPVDEFLQSAPDAAPNAELRQAVFTRTTRLLRRRRWRRRVALVGALAACYLAGVLTMRLATPAPDQPRPERAGEAPRPPAPEDTPAVAAAVAEDHSALALEWRAFESSERRVELYRLAGDRYLEQERDLQSALRCYRQALDASPSGGLAIEASDNWLLIALKEARQKEDRHANNGG